MNSEKLENGLVLKDSINCLKKSIPNNFPSEYHLVFGIHLENPSGKILTDLEFIFAV